MYTHSTVLASKLCRETCCALQLKLCCYYCVVSDVVLLIGGIIISVTHHRAWQAEADDSLIQTKAWISAVMVRDQCSLDRSSTSDQTHQCTHLTNVIIPGGNQLWAVGNQGFNLIKNQTAHRDMECVGPLVLQLDQSMKSWRLSGGKWNPDCSPVNME